MSFEQQAERKRQAADMQRKLEEMEREEERQEARRRAEADLYLKVNYYEVRHSSPARTSPFDLGYLQATSLFYFYIKLACIRLRGEPIALDNEITQRNSGLGKLEEGT